MLKNRKKPERMKNWSRAHPPLAVVKKHKKLTALVLVAVIRGGSGGHPPVFEKEADGEHDVPAGYFHHGTEKSRI